MEGRDGDTGRGAGGQAGGRGHAFDPLPRPLW